MEAKFQVQFTERVFGNYEELDYAKAFRTNTLPINVQVSEFYFKAGAMKKITRAQQNYISSNYTFDKGLYGSSEMFVNGFMHLINSGMVKRKVYDDLDLQRLLNAEKINEEVNGDTL